MENNIPSQYLATIYGGKCQLIASRHFNQNSNIWILNEHEHEYMELIYFLNGEAQVITSEGETSLTLYDILIHPAGVRHREFVDLHKRQEIINLDIKTDVVFPIQDSFVLKDNTGNMRNIVRMIDYHFHEKDNMSEEIVDALMNLLLLYLCKSAKEQSYTKLNLIDRIVEYVQENYMNELSVKELADIVHVSESYLSRLMVASIGISPMKYVNQVRIDNAKQALHSDLPIEQISSQLGFQEPKYFSKVFKKETGETPTAFRHRINKVLE